MTDYTDYRVIEGYGKKSLRNLVFKMRNESVIDSMTFEIAVSMIQTDRPDEAVFELLEQCARVHAIDFDWSSLNYKATVSK